MFTVWNACLWFSGFFAGAGVAFLTVRFIPQRLRRDFHFHTPPAPRDHADDWKHQT